ncbi:hypothetical protein SAMN06298216_3523 [Spirosomataceae bacterium TFI 002]|nr:hypothetical protein SAMN06298216_3523 [Spirosomataceae bacterium TFI 002]
MKLSYKLLCLISLYTLTSIAQEPFELKLNGMPKKIERSKTQNKIYAFSFKSEIPKKDIFKEYKVSVKSDCKVGTLPQTEFELDFKECTLNNLTTGYSFYVILKANPNLDIERTIKLDLVISSESDPKLDKIKNKADTVSHVITINPIEADTALDQFNYLAYIGTNFDLVDGVKAKNLFFASNIYKLPESTSKSEPNDLGFNLIIYGNRALTLTENLGINQFENRYIRIPGTDSSRVILKEGVLTTTIVSDNLGLVVSPIFNWFRPVDLKRTLRIYYSPQLDFVFRRYTETSNYTNVTTVDSSKIIRYLGSDFLIRVPETNTTFNNAYDLDFGLLGFLFTHETENISVRFHLRSGYSFRFQKEKPSGSMVNEKYNPILGFGNLFYGGRLWITEATSGITLAGEVSNRLKVGDNQPFFNVTLSKALSFKNIGSIFAPVTAR